MADVTEVSTKLCFPILSIIALLSAPLCLIVGAQYCHRVVLNEVNTKEYNSEGDAKEDAQRFVGVEVYFRSIKFALIGAAAGMLLSGLGHLRKEDWPWLRLVTFTGNLCVVCVTLIHYLFQP